MKRRSLLHALLSLVFLLLIISTTLRLFAPDVAVLGVPLVPCLRVGALVMTGLVLVLFARSKFKSGTS